MTPAGEAGPLVFLVAGEASGDQIGQRLIQALRRRLGPLRVAGVGGARMAEEGVESLFPLSDLSLVGVGEVLPHIPKLLRRIRQTAEAIRASGADLVVFIDASGFARGVARRLRRLGWTGPVAQYKAPQTWAYWPWRARVMARNFDLVLCILPFEPAHLAGYGVTSAYIGHPSLESGAGKGDGAAFRRRHGLEPDTPLLLVLPGSRASEIRRSLPLFRRTVERLTAELPGLRLVVPTVETVGTAVTAAVRDWPGQPLVIAGAAERFDAMAAANVALGVTGTVTVELALADLPMVTCYKVSWLTAVCFLLFVRVRYAGLVNLLLDRPAVPELLQLEATPGRLAQAVARLFRDPAASAAQRQALAETRALLAAPGATASEAAAELLARRLEGAAPPA